MDSTGAAELLAARLKRTDVFRDYQHAFENTTGLPLALRHAGSFQAPLHGSRRRNPFCAQMARQNGSCAACLQLQQRVEDEAADEPQTLECFAGLSESAVPVRQGGRLIGFLQTGQVFLRTPTLQGFRRAILAAGRTSTLQTRWKLKAAYFATRVIPRHQYESMMRLLASFASHLAEIANRLVIAPAGTEPRGITRARAFIATHQGGAVLLRDVARTAAMSQGHFCKRFKATTGLTLTDYLARLRVEAAQQMLLDTRTRVSEAAFAAGFQSLSQFNRTFHRVAGESPSGFRRRQRLPARAA